MKSFVNWRQIWIAGLVWALCVQNPVTAEESSVDDSVRVVSQSNFQLKPAPLRICRSYLITEASYMIRINGTPDAYSEREESDFWYVSADLGYVRNVGPAKGLGGSIYFGADHRGARAGLRARIRHWVTDDLTIDFAPGILPNIFDNNSGDASGLVVSLGVGHRTGWSTVIQMERFGYLDYVRDPTDDNPFAGYWTSEKQTAWYLGLKIDGNTGILPVIAGMVVVMLGAASSAG